MLIRIRKYLSNSHTKLQICGIIGAIAFASISVEATEDAWSMGLDILDAGFVLASEKPVSLGIATGACCDIFRDFGE